MATGPSRRQSESASELTDISIRQGRRKSAATPEEAGLVIAALRERRVAEQPVAADLGRQRLPLLLH